jgi:hypothetical protein
MGAHYKKRYRWLKAIAALFLSALLFRCESGGPEVDDEPVVPTFVDKTEAGSVEHGIDAIPESQSIFLEWHSEDQGKNAGYRIYRCNQDTLVSDFELVHEILVENFPTDTFWIDHLGREGKWFYRLKSFNADRDFSEFSAVEWYELIVKPVQIYPVSDEVVQSSNPVFEWTWSDSQILPQFRVLLKDADDTCLWVSDTISVYDYTIIERQYNFDDNALEAALSSGEYRWRIDAITADIRRGSESTWESFTIIEKK